MTANPSPELRELMETLLNEKPHQTAGLRPVPRDLYRQAYKLVADNHGAVMTQAYFEGVAMNFLFMAHWITPALDGDSHG